LSWHYREYCTLNMPPCQLSQVGIAKILVQGIIMPFFLFIHRLEEVVCLANFIFRGGGSHSGRACFWGVRWGFFYLRLLSVGGSCLGLWFRGWGTCAPFCHVALLVTPETSSFFHVLFAFFIRKLLEREGGGGINVHSIGVSCFWAVVSSVLGGSRVPGSWSDGNELEALGLCSSGLLPVRRSGVWSPSLGKLDTSQEGVLS